MTSSEIRQSFLDFFKSKQHTIVPSSSLMPDSPNVPYDMTKVIEAVRQLRGEAHPKVQVPNCNIALAHGTGGSLGTRHVGATVIMERE